METKILIIVILIALMIAILCFVGCQKEEDDNKSEIIESIQAELETTGEVTLTLFETEIVTNGRVEHYIAKVDGKYYVVSAMITDKLTNVDVIKEI